MTVEIKPERLGRFKILGVLGQGAMGIVYKAIDEKIDRLVAIKTLQSGQDLPEDKLAEYKERFVHEAQYAGKLSHPNIVTIYDVGEEEHVSYIAMEYVDGRTLEQVIENDSDMSVRRMIEIMTEICDGMAFAHKHGVIHRDIKPSNIIITQNGHAKIMDFGIAKVGSTSKTVVGTILGTPGYMSPEQISGKVIDMRADIFSLGAVFYELLTQRKAFPGSNLTEVLYRVMNENPTPVSVVNPLVPPVFDNIIMRALRRNPDERYRTVDFLAEDVKRIQLTLTMTDSMPDSETTQITSRTTDWRQWWRRIRADKWLFGLGAYAVLTTFLVILLLVTGEQRRRIAASLTAQRPASLYMSLNIPNADIKIDGRAVRVDRNVVKLDSIDVGEHRILVQSQNYENYETALVFAAGEAKHVDVKMRLSPVEIKDGVDTAFVSILTTPPMSRIETSGGRFIGYTPIENYAFPAGNYTLIFNLEDYFTAKRNVVWRKNRLSQVEVYLEKLRGFVSLAGVQPPTAELYQNGRRLQKNWKTGNYSVEVGEQELQIIADGYESATKNLKLKYNETISLNDSLTPTFGTLLSKSNPSGAEIFLDGSDSAVGIAPIRIGKILASTHRIDGIYKREKRYKYVKVVKQDTTEMTVVFSRPNGYLEFNTTPPGANIYIDRVLRRGESTPSTIEIAPGFRLIRLQHPQFKKFYEITVRVRPEGTTKVEYEFK